MKLVYVVSIVSIVVFLSSCKPKYVVDTMKKVDSLILVVEECEQDVGGNFFDTAAFYYAFIMHDKEIFQSKVFDFPEDTELRKAFGTYGYLEKSFKSIVRKENSVQSDIQYSLHQLQNLHHDLSKGIIQDPDSVETYYMMEKLAVDNLEFQTKNMVERLHSSMESFHKIYPEMERFKDTIKHNFPDQEFSKLN